MALILDAFLVTLGLDAANFEAGVKRVVRNMNDLQRLANSAAKKIMGSFNQVGGASFGGRGGLSIPLIGSYLGANFAKEVAGGFYEVANGYTNLHNKLKVIAGSSAEADVMMKKLLETSNAARVPIEGTTLAFQRFSLALKPMGYSADSVLKIVEMVSKGLALSGAQPEEIKVAMMQLSQGFNQGRLNGENFKSVVERMPVVMQVFADKLKVPVTQLKELGRQGKITTKVMAEALLENQAKIEESFSKMTVTMEQMKTKLKNIFTVSIGKDAEALASKIVKALNWISDWVERNPLVAKSIFYGVLATLTVVAAVIGVVSAKMAIAFAGITAATAGTVALIAASIGLFVYNIVLLINAYDDWKESGEETFSIIGKVFKAISWYLAYFVNGVKVVEEALGSVASIAWSIAKLFASIFTLDLKGFNESIVEIQKKMAELGQYILNVMEFVFFVLLGYFSTTLDDINDKMKSTLAEWLVAFKGVALLVPGLSSTVNIIEKFVKNEEPRQRSSYPTEAMSGSKVINVDGKTTIYLNTAATDGPGTANAVGQIFEGYWKPGGSTLTFLAEAVK